MFTSSSHIIMLLGAFLIALEMLTGISALFLLVLGAIFLLTGGIMEATGLTSTPMIVALVASLAVAAFFALKVWGKNDNKARGTVDGNLYEGETFVLAEDLSADTHTEVHVFGLKWRCRVEAGHPPIRAGDEVVIVKADVGKITVRKYG
ncbi:NfeD family protein [Photobacterium galatheae]|uniref:Uncharacterized protein n=1 Tax=Photobacterium galatheae TaxID=1654360 RepID=A0A066RTF4_9GAMM|nr:NfeD family protein [Photobacterium galatheae]KDM90987.1 hypothetical protein EA58_14645 [Photobacterium galatheae]MCM0149057.1 hypothetical protein [Photobacterium galatheae]